MDGWIGIGLWIPGWTAIDVSCLRTQTRNSAVSAEVAAAARRRQARDAADRDVDVITVRPCPSIPPSPSPARSPARPLRRNPATEPVIRRLECFVRFLCSISRSVLHVDALLRHPRQLQLDVQRKESHPKLGIVPLRRRMDCTVSHANNTGIALDIRINVPSALNWLSSFREDRTPAPNLHSGPQFHE